MYSFKVDANIIRISRDDNDVFAALTVDSFCVRRSGEHEEENREKNEDLWCQVHAAFEFIIRKTCMHFLVLLNQISQTAMGEFES